MVRFGGFGREVASPFGFRSWGSALQPKEFWQLPVRNMSQKKGTHRGLSLFNTHRLDFPRLATHLGIYCSTHLAHCTWTEQNKTNNQKRTCQTTIALSKRILGFWVCLDILKGQTSLPCPKQAEIPRRRSQAAALRNRTGDGRVSKPVGTSKMGCPVKVQLNQPKGNIKRHTHRIM